MENKKNEDMPKIKLQFENYKIIPNSKKYVQIGEDGRNELEETKYLLKSIEEKINIIYKFSPEYKNIYYSFFSKNYILDFVEINNEKIFNFEKIEKKTDISELRELLDEFNTFYFYLMNYDLLFLDNVENKELNISEIIKLEKKVSYFLYGEIQKFENDLKNVFLKTLIMQDYIIKSLFNIQNIFFEENDRGYQSEEYVSLLKEKFINKFLLLLEKNLLKQNTIEINIKNLVNDDFFNKEFFNKIFLKGSNLNNFFVKLNKEIKKDELFLNNSTNRWSTYKNLFKNLTLGDLVYFLNFFKRNDSDLLDKFYKVLLGEEKYSAFQFEKMIELPNCLIFENIKDSDKFQIIKEHNNYFDKINGFQNFSKSVDNLFRKKDSIFLKVVKNIFHSDKKLNENDLESEIWLSFFHINLCEKIKNIKEMRNETMHFRSLLFSIPINKSKKKECKKPLSFFNEFIEDINFFDFPNLFNDYKSTKNLYSEIKKLINLNIKDEKTLFFFNSYLGK